MDRRILIGGGPRTGKTTLADELAVKLNLTLRHTDDANKMEWSAQSDEVAQWMCKSNVVIEGCTVFRALRKWLDANPTASAVGMTVIYLKTLGVRLTKQQQIMTKGIGTTFNDIRHKLQSRGIEVHVFFEFTTAERVKSEMRIDQPWVKV